MTEGSLTAEAVSVRHAEGDWVLCGANLEAPAASTTGLIAPNGAGKTTFAQALIGLIPEVLPGEVRGKLCVSGAPILGLSIAKRRAYLSYTFQDVDAQLLFGSVLDCLGGAAALEQPVLREAFNMLGVKNLLHRQADQLSAGEAQRVLIVMALRQGAPVLIYDECTSYLDPVARREFKAFLQFLRSQGLSVLLMGQRREIVAPFCSASYFLQSGVFSTSAEDAVPQRLHAPLQAAITRHLDCGCDAVDIEIRDGTAFIAPGAALIRIEEAKFPAGTSAALVGPNGAGKSTLLRLIAGRMKMDSGTLKIGEEEIKGGSRRCKTGISLLSDSPQYQFTRSTIGGELSAFMHHDSGRAVLEEARSVFAFLKPETDPLELSYGQQKLLTLLMAILSDAPVILLDEPEQGLDDRALSLFRALVEANEATRAKTLIFATHELSLAAMAQSTLLIDQGVILARTVAPHSDKEVEDWFFSRVPASQGEAAEAPPTGPQTVAPQAKLASLLLLSLAHAVAGPWTTQILVFLTACWAMFHFESLRRGKLVIFMTAGLFGVLGGIIWLVTGTLELGDFILQSARFLSLSVVTLTIILSMSISDMLGGLRYWGMPSRIAIAIGTGLRFFPLIAHEFSRVTELARGKRAGLGHSRRTALGFVQGTTELFAAVLLGVVRRVDALVVAIYAQGMEERISARPSYRWRRVDFFTVLLSLATALLSLYEAFLTGQPE